MNTLSVVIPTVDGRSEHLDRLVTNLSAIPFAQIIEIWNLPTCGEAWQTGIEQAEGEYTCCLADDLCPRTEDWYLHAMKAWDEGWCPVPRIWTQPSGEFESAGIWRQDFPHSTVVPTTTIPFFRTDFWKGRHIMPQVHYESDNIFADWCKREDRECRVVENFSFNHWWASAGRKRHPNDYSAEAL